MRGERVIIGMGNPFLTDDGVGIAVARGVAERLQECLPLHVVELHTGGIRLMEAMTGYRQAVVIDAMRSGAPAGTVQHFDPRSFVTTKNTFSTHDTDFATAFDLGRMAGLSLPEQVDFWGIEAEEVELFGEEFTAGVAAAVPTAIERIAAAMIAGERAA